jgi:hypothetical protein
MNTVNMTISRSPIPKGDPGCRGRPAGLLDDRTEGNVSFTSRGRDGAYDLGSQFYVAEEFLQALQLEKICLKVCASLDRFPQGMPCSPPAQGL